MKACTKCNVFKKSTKFYKDKTKKDGLCSSCKSCRKEYRIANADKIKEYRIANADKINKYTREYHKANAEKIKQKRKEDCKVKSDKIKEEIKTDFKYFSKDFYFDLYKEKINELVEIRYNDPKKKGDKTELEIELKEFMELEIQEKHEKNEVVIYLKELTPNFSYVQIEL